MDKYRRDFLIKMGCSVLCLLFSSERTMGSLVLPKQVSSQNISHETVTLEHFYQLSSWLTYQNDLDENVAGSMFDVFKDEPWGKGHIASIYNKLGCKIASEQEVVDIAELIEIGFFTKGESWFISHLVMTWYLGIHYHDQQGTSRVTYEGALMRKIAGDYAPIPYHQRTPYGKWSVLPDKLR